MKKLIIFIVALMFSTGLFAQKTSATKYESKFNISKLTSNSEPFSCHIGRFKIINVSREGAFKKFSLKGVGILINSEMLSMKVHASEDIVYMVPSSEQYIKKGNYISVACKKSLSIGGSPFPLEFYVKAK